MAGDWLKVEIATPEKPEVIEMAAILSLDPERVFAKLFRVWGWFDQHTTDGCARGITKAFIDSLVRATGFADAMEKCGWLLIENDRFTMPHFDRNNGKSAKKRALAQQTMRRSRCASRATKAQPEKRREENNNTTTTTLPFSAPSAHTPANGGGKSGGGKVFNGDAERAKAKRWYGPGDFGSVQAVDERFEEFAADPKTGLERTETDRFEFHSLVCALARERRANKIKNPAAVMVSIMPRGREFWRPRITEADREAARRLTVGCAVDSNIVQEQSR